jgi:hypothetical protein
MSYARFDDVNYDEQLTQFRERLSAEVRDSDASQGGGSAWLSCSPVTAQRRTYPAALHEDPDHGTVRNNTYSSLDMGCLTQAPPARSRKCSA